MNDVIEELKQGITAIAAKVKRYQGWVDAYRQNRLFESDQRQFYRELDQEEERSDDDQPVAEDLKQFWGNIWSNIWKQDLGETYGNKTCEVKLMLKNRRR